MSFHQTISKSIVLAQKTAARNVLGQVTIFNLNRLSSRQKNGGGGVMLQSAITYVGVGWFCKIDSNIKQMLYKDILKVELELILKDVCKKLGFHRDQIIFQYDNDSIHTSNSVRKYFSEQVYEVIKWLPQLSNLNPIENMQALLKKQLNEYETACNGILKLQERVKEI